MSILFWRGRVSKAKFRELFIEALRAEAPQLNCVASSDDDLEFSIEGFERYQRITQRLDNAYTEFRKDPAARQEIMARWVAGILTFGAPRKISPDTIVPIVKSRTWLANSENPESLVRDEYNEELVVVYAAYGEMILYLTHSDLSDTAITREHLRPLAMRNLRTRATERHFLESGGGWMIGVGGNFEASMLLDDEFWLDSRFSGAQTLLAAVPDRNTILASTDVSVDAVWQLAFTACELDHSEAYPISSQLLIRRNGHFDLLDPRTVDEQHPIPNLDVIDVAAKTTTGERHLVIVIATPLTGEPRSVFRLFRKLEIYLQELGCGRGTRPAPDKSHWHEIHVHIHPDSDAAVIARLESLVDYVAGRGAKLEIQPISS